MPEVNTGSGAGNGPVVRVNGAGDIFVAYQTQTSPGIYHVSVARYGGTTGTWQVLGGPLMSAGSAIDYDMTIDGSGAPVVANTEFVSAETGSRVFTYRWNGAAWQAPAPGLSAGPPPVYISGPTLAFDGKGRLVVAWQQHGLGGTTAAVYVARYQP